MYKYYFLLVLTLGLAQCKNDKKEQVDESDTKINPHSGEALAVTLDGERLLKWVDSDSIWALRDENIKNSRMAYLSKIEDPKSYLNYARAYSQSGKVENAIDILSKGITKFPDVADFYVYRGENMLLGRQLTECVDNFWKAGQKLEKSGVSSGLIGMVEEDSIANMSLSYRNYLMMAIAFYCNNDMSSADKFFEVCGDFSTNSDLWIRSYYWQYACYSRSNRVAEAKNILKNLSEDMQILPSSKPYLDAMKFYKGLIKDNDLVDPEFKPNSLKDAKPWLIKMHAVGLKNLLEGNMDKATTYFLKMKQCGYWNTIEVLVAEAELMRIAGKKYQEPEKIELNSNQKKKPNQQ
ncbi:MAG: hypothetical protein ABI851_02335 [Saprospiraceae bacterium]